MALTDKLTAIADGFRLSRGSTQKYSLDEMAVLAAEKGDAVPDGTKVTFGNVDGTPAERNEAYAISSESLNAIGAIIQTMVGKSGLLTVSDMIYWLNRVKYVPQGNAESSFELMSFETSAVGSLGEG